MANVLRKNNKINQDRGIKIAFTVIFSIVSLMLLFPFAWILLNSFKSKAEFLTNSWSFPKPFEIANYKTVFNLQEEMGVDIDVVQMFLNTIILCLIVPTVGQISTILAAYVMAKYKFFGQKVLYVIYILPMLVAITGTLSSTYLLLEKWNMVGNYWGIIVMSAGGTGFNFLMMYSLFRGVSDAYMESARIDGAGHLRTFFKIMLPHVMGLVGTMWILGFIGVWNDYATPKVFLGTEYFTIATGIEKIGDLVETNAIGSSMSMRNNFPVYFAAVILSLVPVVTIFFIFQKQIMKMSLGGGIK